MVKGVHYPLISIALYRIMEKLTDLPNIGPQLAKHLKQVGVETPEQLRCSNAESLFIQIRANDPSACVCKLMAIDGAIRGIRWHDLPAERKNELKQVIRMLEKRLM